VPTITLDDLRALLENRHDAEPRLRALLHATVDAIITIDQHGIIESVNPATERLFGYSASELLGSNVSMLMASPHRERHDSYLQRYLMTGERRIIGLGREVEARRKDGSAFPVDLAVTEFEVHGTRMFTGLVRDISDRRAAEQAAQSRLDELAHAGRLADLGLATSAIAHEVNQPLTAIVSFAHACQRLLDAKDPDPEVLREALGRIAEQGERASTIIARIRDMSRKRERVLVAVDLNVAVTNVLELMTRTLRDRSVAVETALAESLPLVEADQIQIEQVIMNLVTNAVEAMVDAGVDSPRIRISSEISDGQATLTVSDNGPGLSAVQLEQVFDEFYTTKTNGLGVGLSICRDLAEALDGRLTASSAPGGGATFHLALPTSP
jgi:two-component system sensor kinase FixL